MSVLVLLLILLTHSCNVAGQIVMKSAVQADASASRVARFAMAIGALALSFFLTLGLLQHFDLSYLYPFQASSVILMAVGTRIFLGEKLSRRNLLAMSVIAAGVAFVSTS